MSNLVAIAWDGDGIGSLVGRAVLRDDPAEVSRLSHGIERGNQVFVAWVSEHRGSIVSCGGDEGCAFVPADRVGDLPDIMRHYEGATGAPVSVGVGVKMSEAAKALLVAKHHGGDQVLVYDEGVEDQLKEIQPPTEDEKQREHYGPALGKAEPAVVRDDPANQGGPATLAPELDPARSPVLSPDPAGVVTAQPPADAAVPPSGEPILPISVADAVPQQAPIPAMAAPSLQDRVRQAVDLQARAEAAALERDGTAADEVRARMAEILTRVGGRREDLQALVQHAPGVADALTELLAVVRDLARTQPRGMAKAEGLAKGVMQRLMPYDPRVRPAKETQLWNWVDTANERAHIPEMPAGSPERARALHKLSALTQIRRAQDGKREFLLHRGVSQLENKGATKTPDLIQRPRARAGTFAAEMDRGPTPGLSSWTPLYGVAAHHAQRYVSKKAKDQTPVVQSGWVHEDQIHTIPKQYGDLQMRLPGDPTFAEKPGPTRLRWEQEVMVKPHVIPRASAEEVASAAGRAETPDARIERRAPAPPRPSTVPEEKSEGDAPAPHREARGGGEAGREHVVRPVGAIKEGRVKVRLNSGGEGWRSVRSGMVETPDGQPASAKEPNTATGQMQEG